MRRTIEPASQKKMHRTAPSKAKQLRRTKPPNGRAASKAGVAAQFRHGRYMSIIKGAGRPRIIETPEEFDQLVTEYVLQQIELNLPLTWTGMAIHLGFASRQSMWDYANRSAGFSYSVNRARLFVEYEYELRLHGPNSNGAQFALGNFGWSSPRQRIDSTNISTEIDNLHIDWGRVDDDRLDKFMRGVIELSEQDRGDVAKVPKRIIESTAEEVDNDGEGDED